MSENEVTQGAVVQWRHDTMPYGAWRRGVAEIWDYEAECWYVRDTEGFLVRVAQCDENILPSKDGLPITAAEEIAYLRGKVNTYEDWLARARSNGQAAHDALCLAEKGHAEAQDMLESLRDELQTLKLDHAALTDTFNEVKVKGWHWCPDGSYVCDTTPSPWATHISRVIGVRVDHECVGVWSVCILLDAHPKWMTVQAWHAGSSHVTGGVVVADGEQEEAARACAAQIMDDLRAWHGRGR